jgi:hypothetical protein
VVLGFHQPPPRLFVFEEEEDKPRSQPASSRVGERRGVFLFPPLFTMPKIFKEEEEASPKVFIP